MEHLSVVAHQERADISGGEKNGEWILIPEIMALLKWKWIEKNQRQHLTVCICSDRTLKLLLKMDEDADAQFPLARRGREIKTVIKIISSKGLIVIAFHHSKRSIR